MSFLDEQFRELEEDLKLTNKSKYQLRNKILHIERKDRKRNLKHFGWITIACVLLVITAPFYSSTMASVVEKILPISITPSFSDGKHNPDLTSRLFELVEKEGYKVNSVGITPPYHTIEVLLSLDNSTLTQAIDNIEPKITNYLYENGYDQFNVKIAEAPEEVLDGRRNEASSLFDKVNEIVTEIFTKYGYADEADLGLTGVQQTWFSYNVTIDMPDHIQESADIIADIEKEIKSQSLDVKGIEVTTFNLEHRQQDYRWGYVASTIYDALAGKSSYQLTGMSYKVSKGHSYVSIKTDLDKPPTEVKDKEIELAIKEYLSSPEIQELIQNDSYTIQLLLRNKKAFVEVVK